jgi:hypothetical protein
MELMNFRWTLVIFALNCLLCLSCGGDAESERSTNKAEEANKKTKAILRGEAITDTLNQTCEDTLEVSEDTLR